MNIEELRDNYQIHPDVVLLIERVESETGKQTEFLAIYDLNVDATVRIARSSMPRHTIRFKSSEMERLNHLIAFSCAQILRLLSAPAHQRFIPTLSEVALANAGKDIGSDLLRLNLTQAKQQQIINLWVEGLIRQLTNVPSDVFINQWLRVEYPDLRFEQRESLLAEMHRNEQVLSKQVQRVTPRLIFNASNTLNYVYRSELAEITGERSKGDYRMYKGIVSKGRTLRRILNEISDQGHQGDRMIIDRWAEELGVREWFQWKLFDEMSEDYKLGY